MIIYDPEQDYTHMDKWTLKREIKFLTWYVKHLEDELRWSKFYKDKHVEKRRKTLKFENRADLRRAYRMGDMDRVHYAGYANQINAFNRLIQFEDDKIDFFETQIKNYKALLMYFKEIRDGMPKPKRIQVYKVKFRDPYRPMKRRIWETDRIYAEKQKAKKAESVLREEPTSDVES